MDSGEVSTDYLDAISPFDQDEGKSRRRLFAALASAIVPGFGQWLLGNRRRAAVYAGCLLLICSLYWPIRAPKQFWGLIFLAWFTLALFGFATWDALRNRYCDSPQRSSWWLLVFLPIAVLAPVLYTNLLFRLAGFRNYSLPSPSMETTIRQGNLLVADLFAYRNTVPRPFEVIVFRKDRTPFVKRVIAGPGSTIEGRSGVVIVDGSVLSEPYVRHSGNPPPSLIDFGPIAVPAGKLFVMGDNRDVSYDSRTPEFGFVDVTEVLGKPLYSYRSAKGYGTTPIE